MKRSFLLLAAVLFLLTGCSSDQPSYTPSSRVLVTAAHLRAVDGYTCIYSNPTEDFAVFIKDDYKAVSPPVGSEVSLAGTTGTILSVSSMEFDVQVDDIAKIVPGVSGTQVLYSNVPVGFISGWNGEGALRCIFY